MINIAVYLEEILIGFMFTMGIILIFFSSLTLGLSLILVASIAYYFKRRRVSNEQQQTEKNN